MLHETFRRASVQTVDSPSLTLMRLHGLFLANVMRTLYTNCTVALRLSLLFCRTVLLGILALAATGCATLPRPAQVESTERVTVTLDPRIELLTIAQGIGDYPHQSVPLTLEYGQEVWKYFQSVADHDLVRFLETQSLRGFSFDAPVVLALSLNPMRMTKYLHPLPDHNKARVGGAAGASEFANLMAEFTSDSSFGAFYEAHRHRYVAWTEQLAAEINQWGVVGTLESFFGSSLPNPTIVITPMMRGPRFGPLIGGSVTEGTAYVVMGRTTARIVEGTLDPTFRVSAGTVRSLYHEFSHSMVHPLTQAHYEAVMELHSLAEPLKARLTAMGYGEWDTMLNEHVVRAITIHLSFGTDSQTQERALIREEEFGFEYIRPIYKAIAEYASNREAYPHFGDFYPSILSKLSTTES